jgi:subtilisin family serine protease
MKPAWSWQFEPERLASAAAAGRVAALPVTGPITPEWAWGGADGAGVKVAVIDSGIDASHPAVGSVEGGVVVDMDRATGEAVVREEAHGDAFGHGTACAAIIRSLAPACSLYSVRVLSATLSGKGPVFIAGLRWAVEAGMDVVNLSLGTGKRDYYAELHEVVDEAYFKGMVLVTAANNLPQPSFPSLYSSVFSVAAHEGQDPWRFDYNPSPPVEFGAPGIDVEVAWKDGATIRASGNSFAAPHIAGLAARVLSRHPGLTPFQMKTVLHALAANAHTANT